MLFRLIGVVVYRLSRNVKFVLEAIENSELFCEFSKTDANTSTIDSGYLWLTPFAFVS